MEIVQCVSCEYFRIMLTGSMKPPPKHSEIKLALAFSGTRWPRAEATLGQHRYVLAREIGIATGHQGYADVAISVVSGKGKELAPELHDASWRTLSELNLADPAQLRNS